MGNRVLARARSRKRDEFYTFPETIERELDAHAAHLAGKTVLCPCDDPDRSAFTRVLRLLRRALADLLRLVLQAIHLPVLPVRRARSPRPNDGYRLWACHKDPARG